MIIEKTETEMNGTDISVHSETRLRRSLGSETRNPRWLEIFTAAVKPMEDD